MGSVTDDLDTLLPVGAWDSHVHIADEQKFPYHESHPYRPKKADLEDLLAFQEGQGITYSCLVAFSVYHTDNSIILDGLRRLNGKGRAVVCIDVETTTDAELQELHDAGARGIRLNLRTAGLRPDKAGFAKILTHAADRIRNFGWIIQLYVSMDQIAEFAPIVPTLGIPVVVDHIGHPDPSQGPPRVQKGYQEFMELLKLGLVYTKLSGTYRFHDLPELDLYVREILTTAPDRVVWASDWPHSGGVSANPGGDRNKIQEYRKVDNPAWVAKCKAWCRRVDGDNGEILARKIWVDNPRRLWQYDGDN